MRRTTCVALSLFAVLALAALPAVAGPPRPSPTANLSQVVGVAEVEITYARPSVRERTVWGELVPWGETWRTGANEATTFTLSHDAKVQGKPLAAGTYALFTVPGKDSWDIVFNKVAEQWGAFQHDAEQDALKVSAKPRKAAHQEMLEIRFDEVSDSSAQVVLHWEQLKVPFEVSFDTPALAYSMALEEAADDPRAASQWARYFYGAEAHTEKALEWATQAMEARKSYWSVSLVARLQARAGKHEAARGSAKEALGMVDESNSFQAADAAQLKEEMGSWT